MQLSSRSTLAISLTTLIPITLALSLTALLPSTLTVPLTALIARRSLPLPVRTVHEFPKGTWIENVAIRSTSSILATLATAPELYQISPLSRYSPVLIHSFAGYSTLLGITETYPDIFYVAAGNFSFQTMAATPGSSSLFEVDFNAFSRTKNIPAKVRKIADLPDAGFLNGAVTLNSTNGDILIADSAAGALWKVNVRTGAVTNVIPDEPLLKPIPGRMPEMGINGVHIRDGVLYFTSTNQGILGRVPLNADGTAAGPATSIASGLPADDFTLDAKGQAYLFINIHNQVAKVAVPGGEATVLAGSEADLSTIAGPSSGAFGRTVLDKTSLYVGSNGGIPGYSGGNFTVGGRISRIDVGLSGYYG
ncbi:MAG: hypothetical protein Q9188_006441 [Gyalolechia gomerana]